MKTKLVIWATNEENQRVLLALELEPDNNKVNIYNYPDTIATDEFSDKLMAEWRNKKDATLPEGYTLLERDLSMTEDLLPENLKTERGDLIQRAKTEWAFIVLSSKLNVAYQTELKDIKETIGSLTAYDSKAWDTLKEFWTKVEEQVREKNLFREHASTLKDGVNELFARLKELRTALDKEFNKISEQNYQHFSGIFANIEERVKENKNLQSLFNELKDVQKDYKNAQFTRDHRKEIWDRLDGAFKLIKEKRFGPGFDKESSPIARLDRRYNGLIAAIGKMEKSIARDKDELAFQNKKIATTDGQLEAQIRRAKITMIEGYITSKEAKLGEMMKTKEMLDEKRVIQQKNEVKREEREKHEAAKKAAKDKIAAQISQQQTDIDSTDKAKLEDAANAIVAGKTKKVDKTETNGAVKEEVKTDAPAETTDTKKEVVSEEAKDEAKEVVKEATNGAKETLKNGLGAVGALGAAGAALSSSKVGTEEDSLLTAISNTMTEVLEDVVNTAKAVAIVVGEKIEEKVEEISESIEDAVNDAKVEEE